MITKEEWDRIFDRLMPVFSIGTGALSITLAIMALRRSSPLGRRVYSEDGRYLVSVRYPGQWHDLREFVTPYDPEVQEIYSHIGPNAWQLLDFVCRNISYRRDIGEFFQFPSETLARGQGDCDDSAILLTSLIRAGGAPNCYVALGSLAGYGHAWCEYKGQVLETTFTSARPVPDPEDYCPYVLVSDQEVIELWPGALGEIFELGRDEATKLQLMADILAA
ncbi:hypothetical protein ES703_84701 [subsurface metagenome]